MFAQPTRDGYSIYSNRSDKELRYSIFALGSYRCLCVNITIEYYTTLRRVTTKEIPLLSDS